MPLDTSQINVQITAQHSTALDLATATFPLTYGRAIAMSNGTGGGQADRIFTDRRTLAASANEDLDLAGVLTDAFGATITFARIKVIAIAAAVGNTNNLVIGNAATNGFITWVGAATHTVTVRPGGIFVLAVGTGDSTGYAVTAGTGDLLRVANSAGGTSVDYDIVLIGASA